MENFKCLTEQMNNYFKDNVKLLFISKFNVIIVTIKEDNVYEFKRISEITLRMGPSRIEYVNVSDIEKSSITGKEEDSIFNTLIENSKLKDLCNENVIDFKNGVKHMVALTSDGNVFSWGLNHYGTLGNGSEQNRETLKPKLIEKASHQEFENNVKDICCGAYHTLALTKDGYVFAWGYNICGQIGNRVWDENKKNNKNALIPTKVEGFKDKIRAISCGAMFSMALTINGCVYIWGHVSFDVEITLESQQKQQCNKPKEVVIGENILIEKISCGREHYLLLSSENFIYAFGHNENAQLGVGHREEVSDVVKLENSSLFQEIAAHPQLNVSAAISSDNSCYIWGFIRISPYSYMNVNEPKECLFKSFAEMYQKLFQITFNSHEIPLSSMSDKFIALNHKQQIVSYNIAHDPGTIFKPIMGLESYGNLSEKLNEYFKNNLKFSFVSQDTVMIVTLKDDVYEFKRRTANMFMHITEGNHFTDMKNAIIALSENFSTIEPLVEKSKVEELCNKDIVEFKNGFEHMIARSIDGDVYCWGINYKGLLGNNQSADFLFHRPELIKLPNDENTSNKIEEICCGPMHTLVRTENGDVYSWGQNYWGQCGNFVVSKVNLKLTLKSKVKQLSDLDFENYDQSRANLVVFSPIKVNGFNGEKVKSISCGGYHSLALTAKGHVFFWGYLGDKKELMPEEHRECNKPKVVFENILFEKISCGQYHCLLQSEDKNIYGFGFNNFAQLGLGFRSQFEPSPIKLKFSSKIIDIAAHPFHDMSAALSEEGDYYVWAFSRGSSVDKPTKIRLKSFEEIFEKNLEISYKTNKGSLIKFRHDFIRDDYFEHHFTSIHREKPRFIHRGAFGKVFKVETSIFNRKEIFAAKKIKFFKTDQKDKMYKSFLKELGTSSSIVKLNHINVVKYFDAWLETDKKEFGRLYFHIIMEYCDYSLEAKIKEIEKNTILIENNYLSYVGFCIAIEIFIQILEGVSHLHKQKPAIIHRDLKPANILFKEEMENVFVKIGDYGLIALHKFADNLVDEQTEGADELHSNQVGDQNYAAPEVINGKEYDTKADIYSIANVSMDLFRVDKKIYELCYLTESEDYCNKIRAEFPKYQLFLIELWNDMYNTIANNRPDCEVIKTRIISSLTANESKAEEESATAFISNDSFVPKLLNNFRKRTNKL